MHVTKSRMERLARARELRFRAFRCRELAAELTSHPEARAALEEYAAQLTERAFQIELEAGSDERRPPLIGGPEDGGRPKRA